MRLTGLISASVCLLHLPAFVFASVEFTSPAAGANVDPGLIKVQWEESGASPSIHELTAYTLVLMVGGNEDGEMLTLATFVSQGAFAAGNEAQGTIGTGIAEEIPNGFFFQIISTSAEGGNVINYSDRFSIKGLTGVTDAKYRDAATALDGSTKGPGSVGDVASSSTSTPAPTSSITSKTGSPTRLATTTYTSEPSAPPSNGNGSSDDDESTISSGALAGIAIAGAVVGLIGMGLAIWMCLRRRKRKGQDPMKLNDDADLSREVLAHPKEMKSSDMPVELDPCSRVVEVDGSSSVQEMDSAGIRAELPGDFVHREPLTPVPDTPLTPMTLRGFDTEIPTPLSPGRPVTPRNHV